MNFNTTNNRIEFTVDNDDSRVVSIDPGDIGIVTRWQKSLVIIKDEAEKLECMDDLDALEYLDNLIREQIDYVFNGPVSAAAFGNTSPNALSGGIPLYERFMEFCIGLMEPAVKEEQKKSMEHISKYTKQLPQGHKPRSGRK